MGNPPMPGVDQMPRRPPPTRDIVRGHLGQPVIILAPVEHHDRNARLGAASGQVVGHGDRRGDDTINLIVKEFGHDLWHPLGRVFGHENQNVIAARLQGLAEEFKGHRIELVLQIGDDEAYDPGAAGDHGAGQGIRAVTQLFRCCPHLVDRGLGS